VTTERTLWRLPLETRLGAALDQATGDYVAALQDSFDDVELRKLDDLVRLQAWALRLWRKTVVALRYERVPPTWSGIERLGGPRVRGR